MTTSKLTITGKTIGVLVLLIISAGIWIDGFHKFKHMFCTDQTVITSMTIDNTYSVTEVALNFDTAKPITIVDGKAKVTVLIETGEGTYVQEGTVNMYQFDNSFISHR